MYATWDFLKRHKRKIVAGTAVAATFYGAKCLLESPRMNQLVQQCLHGVTGETSSSSTVLDEDCLNEARRHFLFDVHQQSCDKTLNNLVVQLRQRIDEKFNTEQLLGELRSAPRDNGQQQQQPLSGQRKIAIWEELKVKALAKILSVLTIFPLVTLVLKTQKSMICQHLYQSMCKQRQQQGTTLYDSGMRFIKSFFYDDPTTSSSTTTAAIENTATNAQKLFNDSIQFLFTEGIDLLFGVLQQISTDTIAGIQLTEPFTAMDVHFLLEHARARVKAIGAGANFTNFVVPTAQLDLPISGRDGKLLQNLLKQFVLILQTQRCRKLMEDFNGQYFEALLQHLDEKLPDGKTLPLAKLIPCLCNAFPHLTTNDHASVFHDTLCSSELHQFTLFVSQCTSDGDQLVAALDGASLF